MTKARQRRHAIKIIVGVVAPLVTIWSTGAYLLYRATQIEPAPSAFHAWILGILLMICSTLIGLQLRRPLSVESRIAHLERHAETEQWGCSTEEGVQAVVTALRDNNHQHRDQPRVPRRDAAKS